MSIDIDVRLNEFIQSYFQCEQEVKYKDIFVFEGVIYQHDLNFVLAVPNNSKCVNYINGNDFNILTEEYRVIVMDAIERHSGFPCEIIFPKHNHILEPRKELLSEA